MFREKNTLHSILRIWSHLWNMVVIVSWLGPVLLHLGQDKPAIIDGTMNSELYQQILKENVRTICSRTESQENVGHAARQQPQAHKSFYQS